MKKSMLLLWLPLFGLVVGLAGCSKSGSPTAPKASPTPQALNLTLTVSATQAVAGEAVEARAAVSQGSSPVADGTPVNFFVSAECAFLEGGQNSITKQTTAGIASVAWTCNTAGDFKVWAAAGSANANASVTFLPPAEEVPQPTIFEVTPQQGSARGGEEVLITGLNLCVYFAIASSSCDASIAPEVRFNPPDAVAEVTWISPDGRALRVKTPSAGAEPLSQDLVADISVTNRRGTATRAGAFVYVAEKPEPQLYALMPNAGPIEGGTQVTIFGTGFQAPVQVLFGDRQAQVISSNYNEIVCIAPSIAPSGPSTPMVVNVVVTNILTGKSSQPLPYRYGEAMFVSGISPTVGYIGDWTPATIYGQGFVAPVQVLVTVQDITKEAQVLSVSGTALQVKMPPFNELGGQQCTPVTATITVTNLGSNLTATAPTFTYVCSPFSGP